MSFIQAFKKEMKENFLTYLKDGVLKFMPYALLGTVVGSTFGSFFGAVISAPLSVALFVAIKLLKKGKS